MKINNSQANEKPMAHMDWLKKNNNKLGRWDVILEKKKKRKKQVWLVG